MLKKDTMLRFWCQKVLPLVYDDSLSYYELLNKVVLHLNQNTENINQLIDFYNTFAEDVEDIIHQMMEDGDFNEIVADTLGSIIANEYDPEHQYIIFDYCIYNSKLYRANGSTTGEFDAEKWDERTVTYDLATIQNYIYTLNAGNIAYDPTASYDSGTVGNKIKNLNANNVAYDPTETYNNDTVGKELKDLLSAISLDETYIAIVQSGNNATKTIQDGQLVILKNNSTLNDGLYYADGIIPAGTAFTNVNLKPADDAYSGERYGVANYLLDIFKSSKMFKHISNTYTTSASGNANITELNGSNDVIIAVKPPTSVAVGFIGRGANGAWYVHLVDSSGTAITSTEVTLDIYYITI